MKEFIQKNVDDFAYYFESESIYKDFTHHNLELFLQVPELKQFSDELLSLYKNGVISDKYKIIETLARAVREYFYRQESDSVFLIANELYRIAPQHIFDVSFVFDNNDVSRKKYYLVVHRTKAQEVKGLLETAEILNIDFDIEFKQISLTVFIADEYNTDSWINSRFHNVYNQIEHIGILNSLYIQDNKHVSFSLGGIREFPTEFREDLLMKVNSTWEANFVRILKYLNIDFKYEDQRFDIDIPDYINKDSISDYDNNFTFTYLPDFKMGEYDFIELKGFWDNKSRMRINGFINKYHEYNLTIIDAEVYKQLKFKFIDKISGWEEDGVSANALISEIVDIVGINRPECKDYVKKIKELDAVIIERDKGNPYDSYAIKANDVNGNRIGFISADWAKIFAPKLDLGFRYSAELVEKRAKLLKVKLTCIEIPEKTFEILEKYINIIGT